MKRGSLIFVAVVFAILGLSFLATTAALYAEFKDHDWFSIAAFYSHLFIFFPTFGILALFAFYWPAAALLDLYWFHIQPFGRVRFVAASMALFGASVYMSSLLVVGTPAVWWLKPQTLLRDAGRPADCIAPNCTRLPVMASVNEVRSVSQRRLGLTPFVRTCDQDKLTETPPDLLQERQCFVTKTKIKADACCKAQEAFAADLQAMYDAEGSHSQTMLVHAALLPLKVFFLLIIFVIGLLLALWRRRIDKHYEAYATRIERGLLIGALAMLIWPVTNHGFIQASTLLYGKAGEGVYASMSPAISVLFAGWAFLLVLFFFRQHERDVEAAGKIGGGVASAVAILKYNEILDYSTRFIGSGIDNLAMIGIAIAVVVGLGALVIGLPTEEQERARQRDKAARGR